MKRRQETSLTPETIELTKRVRQAARLNHITIKTLAEEADMLRQTLTRQLSCKYNIDVRAILTILRLCPNISAEWLLRGNGDICVDKNNIEERLARVEKLLKSGK